MVNNSESIAWLKEGLVKEGITTWQGSGNTVSGSDIILSPNGYIYATLEGLTPNPLSSSNYIKVVTKLKNNIPNSYNYSKGLTVLLKEKYSVSEDESFNRTKNRELMITSNGIKNVNGLYVKEHILEMLGKPLESLYIKITNSSNESITLSDFNLYSSQDLSEYQYQQIQQGATSLFGTIIEARYDDPINPQVGRIWLRIDL